ncbi:MAG: DUF4248 domain-containing protein [Bacteroidales bacterium]|nr:DUF4248 domain-containing protein [Bacteroidales bacterium]
MTENQKTFDIRSYTKKELALNYFPDVKTPKVAVNHLMSWIREDVELMAELEKMGYRSTSKCFTPKQVAAIVQAFGEP